MILLENVSSRREDKYLLQNINWKMSPGENWVLFGLNGSGKTTLLNIITGYQPATTGKVVVLGKEFGTYPLYELRKKIGFVSSSIDKRLPNYDYAENIVLSGKYASIGLYDNPDEDDIDYALSIMKRFKCSNLIHRTLETLSQGEKQKVMIMRALMAKPQLLILDEPCGGLDVIAREQVLELIDTLGNDPEAPAILYVSHHVEEIMPAFSHILLLREGQIYSEGPVNTLITEETFADFLQTKIIMDKINGRHYLKIRNHKQ